MIAGGRESAFKFYLYCMASFEIFLMPWAWFP